MLKQPSPPTQSPLQAKSVRNRPKVYSVPLPTAYRCRRLAHLDQVILHLLHDLVQQLLRVLRIAHCKHQQPGNGYWRAGDASMTALSRSNPCSRAAAHFASAPCRCRVPCARKRTTTKAPYNSPTLLAHELTMRVTRLKRLACTTTALRPRVGRGATASTPKGAHDGFWWCVVWGSGVHL